eukprot:8771788-Pyramimonas_sp.AAC.1
MWTCRHHRCVPGGRAVSQDLERLTSCRHLKLNWSAWLAVPRRIYLDSTDSEHGRLSTREVVDCIARCRSSARNCT